MQFSRAVAVATAIAAPLALCSAASAAWFNAADLTGAASGARIVTSGTAGALSAAATGFTGSLVGAAHAPGGAFGGPAVLAPGTEDFPAQIGPGGAILTSSADRPSISRLRPDGSVSPAFPFGEDGSTAIGTAAVAPSGAALAVVSDEDGDAQVWRQPNEAAPPVRLARSSLPQGASTASVVPMGEDGFVVALSAPFDEETGAGVQVRAFTVSGTTANAVRIIQESPGAEDSVFTLEAIGGATPMVAYVLETSSGSSLRAAPVIAEPNPRTVDAVSGEEQTLDTIDTLATPTGAVLAWTLTNGETISAKYGHVSAAGAPVCAVAEPFTAVALANRGTTPMLAGVAVDGRVGLVPAPLGCPAGAPQYSEAAPNAVEIALAGDADGTLIAAVGRGLDNTTRIVVDDITPAAVGQPQMPAVVRPNQSFSASVAASDPWGVAGVEWSVDGDVVARGANVTIPGQDEGEHTVRVRVTNAAGLESSSQGVVVARSLVGATPTPTPTPTPQPAAPPTTTAVDTTAPVISSVSVRRDLFRPLATAAALPRGSSVRFRLSESASVRVTVLRGMSKKGGKSRCETKPGATVPKRPKGGSRVLLVTRPLAAGPAGLQLTGRDSKGKRLPRGRYRVSLTATDAAGNRSEPVFIRFTLC